jgi:hypothetical protein
VILQGVVDAPGRCGDSPERSWRFFKWLWWRFARKNMVILQGGMKLVQRDVADSPNVVWEFSSTG